LIFFGVSANGFSTIFL